MLEFERELISFLPVSCRSPHPLAETIHHGCQGIEKSQASKYGSNRICCCCSLLVGEDLGLERVGSREGDRDLVGGDLVVDLGHSLELGLNLFLVEGVEEDLQVLLAIEGHSG